jgi:hypothetical protein
MSEKLKDHIENNRDQFEVYPFDTDKGWQEIKDKIIPEERKNTVTIEVKWLYRSVAAVLICILGLVFMVNNSDNNQLPREYWEAHTFYQGQIDNKLIQVRERISDPVLLEDFDELDLALEELKRDLKDDAKNEEVIFAMIENYRLKLMILENILEELEEKDYEKDNNI